MLQFPAVVLTRWDTAPGRIELLGSYLNVFLIRATRMKLAANHVTATTPEP